ncbi:hypothetical protein [Aeromonas sp. EERV15]|uniref:hypothetical protein n=1 Tax=Aeromonas sp. EERV15 TaxID=1833892 RepID=UPI00083A28B2|nr:hypothetical protein [Aeromonas sp. EERV15]
MHTLEQLRAGELCGARHLKLSENLAVFPSEIFSAVGCNEIAPLIWRLVASQKAALQTVQCAALIAPYVFR